MYEGLGLKSCHQATVSPPQCECRSVHVEYYFHYEDPGCTFLRCWHFEWHHDKALEQFVLCNDSVLPDITKEEIVQGGAVIIT